MAMNLRASVLKPQCPSRIVLDRIAENGRRSSSRFWPTGRKRYAELRREIGGISQKMLTQTLRSLERDGLVLRKVHPVVPPKVEYSLTRLGRTLIDPLQTPLPMVGKASAGAAGEPQSRAALATSLGSRVIELASNAVMIDRRFLFCRPPTLAASAPA